MILIFNTSTAFMFLLIKLKPNNIFPLWIWLQQEGFIIFTMNVSFLKDSIYDPPSRLLETPKLHFPGVTFPMKPNQWRGEGASLSASN